VSLLAGAAVTTPLADLGADVIKVEPHGGDYGRKMTWPLIEGDSLLFLHCNRGKRSIELDLKDPIGVAIFKDFVATADVVVEVMRPGALERLGLGFDVLRSVKPSIVHLAMSGYGASGPYRNLPSHGVAFDAWAGIVEPEPLDGDGCVIPDHVSIGLNAAPSSAPSASCPECLPRAQLVKGAPSNSVRPNRLQPSTGCASKLGERTNVPNQK